MLDTLEKILSIGGNLATLILAVVAFIKRDRISLIFRYLQFSYFSEKSKRLKETLGKLDALDYNDKESRAEILALLGQISGQLKTLENGQSAVAVIQTEISAILNKKVRLSEPIKRRILHSIHGEMDESALKSFTNLPKSSQ